MNRLDAAHQLARRYPGGIEAVAQRMAAKPDTLRKKLTGAEGYNLRVDEEEELIDLCVAARVSDPLAPLTAAVGNRGGLVILLPAGEDGDSPSFQCLADTAREFSEFVSTVAQAEADGKVTANELRRIEREGSELVASMQRCIAHMHAQHEAGKPVHLRTVKAA